MEEIFVDIKGYEGLYQISNFGRVKSLERHDRFNRHILDKILYLKKHRCGYHQVFLSKNGAYKYPYVHRLVALHFIPIEIDRKFVNHKDGNKTNNHVGNLEWCTRSENMIHAVASDCDYQEKRGKLKKEQVREILILLKESNKSQREIGLFYGVSQTQISRIKRGMRWSNIV